MSALLALWRRPVVRRAAFFVFLPLPLISLFLSDGRRLGTVFAVASLRKHRNKTTENRRTEKWHL